MRLVSERHTHMHTHIHVHSNAYRGAPRGPPSGTGGAGGGELSHRVALSPLLPSSRGSPGPQVTGAILPHSSALVTIVNTVTLSLLKVSRFIDFSFSPKYPSVQGEWEVNSPAAS